MLLYRVILAQLEIDVPVLSSTRSAERGRLAGNLPPPLHYKHVRHPTVQPKQNTLNPRGFCQFLAELLPEEQKLAASVAALCPRLPVPGQRDPGAVPRALEPSSAWQRSCPVASDRAHLDTLAGVSHGPHSQTRGHSSYETCLWWPETVISVQAGGTRDVWSLPNLCFHFKLKPEGDHCYSKQDQTYN